MFTRKTAFIIVTVLSASFLIQAAWFRSAKSLTFDETFYLSCGLQTVHDGELDSRIAGQGVGPLPIMLNYVIPLSFTAGENRADPWHGKFNDRNLIKWPRILNSFLFGASLISLIFIWLYRRQGLTAAVLGTTLAVFSPTVLAHASLATTDASFAFFSTLGIATSAWYFKKTGRVRFLIWATVTAAAMTAKYSGVFLLPVAGILFFLNADRASTGSSGYFSRLKTSGKTFTIYLSLVVSIWWGFHLFTFTGPLKKLPSEKTPDSSPWVQILGRGPWAEEIMDISHTSLKKPAPVAGVVFQYYHNNSGHDSFLMGQRSTTGWWYFFPCAFVFKSTPSELVLSAFLILLMLSALRSPRLMWKNLDPELQAILLAVIIFIAMVLTSSVNIGQRYLIVLYPLLIIAGIDRLAVHLKEKPKLVMLIGTFLVTGQITSSLMIAPNYLAYFNSINGGPEQGWRLLSDSNIDWGQDLPALKNELAKTPHKHTALCYFGTAIPISYGVYCDEINNLSRPVESYQQLAISASYLQGLYIRGNDPFAAFRSISPDARAGYSILLFSLDTPRKRKAFAAAIKQFQEPVARTQTAGTRK